MTQVPAFLALLGFVLVVYGVVRGRPEASLAGGLAQLIAAMLMIAVGHV